MKHLLRTHDISRTDLIRGHGCHLFDRNGNRYVDLESGIWCVALGHSHPRITAVARRQLGRVVHLGTRHPSPLAETAAVALLERLALCGGKCLFLSSGSEAMAFALRAAGVVTRRPLFLTLAGSYLGAYEPFARRERHGWLEVDWDSCGACARGDLSCRHLAAIPFDDVAAFVLEPGSASGTVQPPPARLVTNLASSLRRHGGLLVANEVTTGLGRTGTWFGFEHYGLRPDIVALGKALGNGFPVSAVAMRDGLAQALEKTGFRYAQSHQNDPFGCAVALEVLAVLEDEKLIERSRRLGELFLRGLDALADSTGGMAAARGRGLMVALQLHEQIPAPQLAADLMELGFLAGSDQSANLLRFFPPLIIDEEDIQTLLLALERLLPCPTFPAVAVARG